MADRVFAHGGVTALRRMRVVRQRFVASARVAWQRFTASARAGCYLGLRRSARFVAKAVDQDGILLLMPREPSFAFYYVPLLVLAAALGAGLAAFG
jgi:hypothetical protein